MAKDGESKFYQTKEFKALYQEWVTGKKINVKKEGILVKEIVPSKLARSGFKDIETSGGSLKTKNMRTQGFQTQEEISKISSALMSYICHRSVKLSRHQRKILELHSQGVYHKEIRRIVKKSKHTVWRVIKTHTPKAISLALKEEEETFCPYSVEINEGD